MLIMCKSQQHNPRLNIVLFCQFLHMHTALCYDNMAPEECQQYAQVLIPGGLSVAAVLVGYADSDDAERLSLHLSQVRAAVAVSQPKQNTCQAADSNVSQHARIPLLRQGILIRRAAQTFNADMFCRISERSGRHSNLQAPVECMQLKPFGCSQCCSEGLQTRSRSLLQWKLQSNLRYGCLI